MAAVLGIDAAWTPGGSSAVALVVKEYDRWVCRALAPSYDAFVGLCAGEAIDWTQHFAGSTPNISLLLQAAEQLLDGQRVAVAAVDMPLAHTDVVRRRAAEQAIASTFGGRGCSPHSPTADRPGALSGLLRDTFAEHTMQLATTITPVGTPNRLLEVYPHPALLSLLNAPYRVPYKVDKVQRYWPQLTPAERLAQAVHELDRILTALRGHFEGIALHLPDPGHIASRRALKRYEDAVDALVCAWVGAQYLDGNAVPYGDADAAIWVPAGMHRHPDA